MFSNILVAVDGSDISYAAFDRAAEIAKWNNAKLHAIFVIETRVGVSGPMEPSVEIIRQRLEEEGEDTIQHVLKQASEAGVTLETHTEVGSAGSLIVKTAEKLDSDLVVAGSLGKSAFDRLFLGSVSSYVAKETNTNFLIVRDEGKKKEKLYSNILAAVDGSAISYLAFNRAADIAKQTGAALHAVHVRSSKEQDSAEGEMDVLEKVKELAADKQIAVEIHEEGGHPGNVIVKLADDLGSDLIVAGSLGKSAINRLFLGSVSSYIAKAAKTNFLIVRP